MGTTALLVSLGMSCFEWLKQWFYPAIEIWPSHLCTIIFSTLISTVVAGFVARGRKRMDDQKARELVRERHRLDEILTTMPAMVFENSTGNGKGPDCSFVNHFVEKIFGFTREEWLSSPNFWFTRVHPDDREIVTAEVAALSAGQGTPGGVVTRWLAKDGRTVWGETHLEAIRDRMGVLRGIRGVTLDVTARQRAEDVLRERDGLMRIAGRVTRAGGWILEIPGNRIFWSDEVFEILEFPPGTVPPLAEILALYPPQWGIDLSAALDACMREGTPFDIELQVQTAKGRRIWVRCCGEAERAPDGSIHRILGAYQDISERRQAAEALSDSEQRYRSLVEATTVMVWDTNAAGELEGDQPGWSGFTGQSHEQYRGWGWLSAIHPDDQEETARVWTAAVANHTVYEVDQRVLRSDHTYRDMMVRAVPLLNRDGTIRRWVGVHTDITDRKRAAEELEAKETLLRQFVRHAPAAIAMLDLEMRYVQVSERWTQDYQLSAERLIGQSHYEIFPNLPQRWKEIHQRVLAGSIEASAEDSFTREDGSTEWLQWEARPWRKPGGEIGGLIFFTQVITERKCAETERAALNRQLVDLSRQAGMAEIATSVLHNVGNVLNSVNISAALVGDVVRGSKAGTLVRIAALLEEHAADLGAFVTSDPQGRKLPEFIRLLSEHLNREQQSAIGELKSLSQNVEHIKDIVAMQQNYAKVSGVREPLRLTDLVEDSLRMDSVSLTRHGFTLVRDFGEVPPITLEKHKVLQILVNLIRNARHACDESQRNDKQITVRISSDQKRALVSVIDNGIGIPPENLSQIFRHGFTTRKNGHGFGLHNAVLTAREMGGDLTVQSAGPGSGATFTLELPIESGVGK